MWFLKALICGDKKFVKCDAMRHIYVPQYKGLNIERFLAMTRDYPDVLNYLPDTRDWHKLPRQWLVNIFYSVVGKPFADWVDNVVNERHQNVAEKNDLMIAMDPEIAKAFQESTAISSKLFLVTAPCP